MIPASPEAEHDLLGTMLISADARAIGFSAVCAEDFHSPGNGAIFSVMCNLHAGGRAVDVTTVVNAMPDERERVLGLFDNPPVVGHARDYAETIVSHAAARRVMAACNEASHAVMEGADPYSTIDSVQAQLAAIDTPADRDHQEASTMEEIVASSESSSPWAIEGLLRKDWRVLLVAEEGQGKSVILRQMAMLAAQGIHPFKFTRIPPIRTLIVDLENPVAAIAETGAAIMGRLQTFTADGYDGSRCRIFRRPAGLDLRTRHDRGELEREVTLQCPDLVCIGPAYKMIHRRSSRGGVEGYEEATEPVHEVLDDLRTRHGFALCVEHHAAKGYGGKRDLSPYGSQRWLAWPEIGLSLRQDKSTRNTWALERHRGDRLISNWPDELSHGDVWPWVGTWKKSQAALLDPPF